MYSDDDFLEIIGCIFQNCYHLRDEEGDSEGGAIEYKRETDNENQTRFHHQANLHHQTDLRHQKYSLNLVNLQNSIHLIHLKLSPN